MQQTIKRHPNVPTRRVALPDKMVEVQRQRGLFTVDRGVTYALPMDHIKRPDQWQGQKLWISDEDHGLHRPGTLFKAHHSQRVAKILAWLRDHVNNEIPSMYYHTVLGHDLHVSTWSNLYAKHWHAGWANPLTGEVEPSLDPWFTTLFATHWVDHECDLPVCPKDTGITIDMLQGLGGFTENLGLLSSGKVTDVFVNVTVGALVASGGGGQHDEFNDFNEHEVGTGSTGDSNNDTALETTSGIALVAGTQVDSGGDPPIYTTVATITADATETWEEHGCFSTGTDSLMDRNLTGGQSVNSSDTVQYTLAVTINPEA